MLTALLIFSLFACTFSQPACDAANQTLLADSDCLTALNVVVAGANLNTTTNASALTIACGGSTTCNQTIRAYLDNCPVSTGRGIYMHIIIHHYIIIIINYYTCDMVYRLHVATTNVDCRLWSLQLFILNDHDLQK